MLTLKWGGVAALCLAAALLVVLAACGDSGSSGTLAEGQPGSDAALIGDPAPADDPAPTGDPATACPTVPTPNPVRDCNPVFPTGNFSRLPGQPGDILPEVTVGTPYHGAIRTPWWFVTRLVYRARFTPQSSGASAIRLSEMTSALRWDLYSNADFRAEHRIAECSAAQLIPELSCNVFLSAGSQYYIQIDSAVGEWGEANADFTLLVPVPVPVAGAPGSLGNPALLTAGAPLAASIAAGGSYHARFATGTGGDYFITVDGAALSLSWTLLRGVDGLTGSVIVCDLVAGSGAESCLTGLEAGATYYLQIVGSSGAAGSVTVTLTAPVPGAPGKLENPVALNIGMPHSGSIAAPGQQYAWFTTGATGPYTIALADVPGSSANWYLWADGFPSIPLVTMAGGSQYGELAHCFQWSLTTHVTCALALPAGTTYYLMASAATRWNNYTLTVSAGAPAGTVYNPTSLVLGVPLSGSFTLGTRYYASFTTAAAGTYTLTNTAGGPLSVFTTASDPYGSRIAYCFSYPDTPNVCSVSLAESTAYFILLENYAPVPFTLSVAGP